MTIQATVFIFSLAIITPAYGLLFTKDASQSILDQVLSVVWEPSSLIRMWVGLDQLYNIALSWRTVAKKLVSLPFDKGRSMDHVKIQEPRHIKYHKPSAASHWDRFNKIYASSSLSPIVADTRFLQQHLSNAILKPDENYGYNSIEPKPNAGILGLPPPFLFHAQDVLVNPESVDLFQNMNKIEPQLPFKNGEDPLAISKYLELQNQPNQNILQDKSYSDQAAVAAASLIPSIDPSAMLNVGPEAKLNRFLKLLKTLGDIHENHVRRDSVDTSNR